LGRPSTSKWVLELPDAKLSFKKMKFDFDSASPPCEVAACRALARATPKCASAPVQQFDTKPLWSRIFCTSGRPQHCPAALPCRRNTWKRGRIELSRLPSRRGPASRLPLEQASAMSLCTHNPATNPAAHTARHRQETATASATRKDPVPDLRFSTSPLDTAIIADGQ
jgi:hypothetical protein